MALSKVDAVDAGKLTNMLSFMKNADELQAGLAAVRRIEKLQPRPQNYEKVFKGLVNGNNENATRGALHVIRDVDSPNVGLDNVSGFEVPDSIRLADGRTVGRKIDVVLKNPLGKRIEYKAWESGRTRWGKVGKEEGAEWEFVKDILLGGDFEWVIKGTELSKVANNMKQTLGELAVRGRTEGAQLHQVLEEALRRGIISKADLEKIIAQIDSGELLRVQGY